VIIEPRCTADLLGAVSGKRLTAAGVVLAMAVFLVSVSAATAGGGGRSTHVHHTCSVTDRQFLQVAQLNMTSLGEWSDDYLHGDAKAADVIREAQNASKRVSATSPSDPSLAQTRALLVAMFSEYSKAIQAKAHHGDAGQFIFHAYGLANLAHDVLVDAEPALSTRGCDVSPLL
jgi:hypothetical protein